jgi:DNA-binding response OmpR family regulator
MSNLNDSSFDPIHGLPKQRQAARMIDGKNFLIVEGEFLIALDMQRILESAGASRTIFARSTAEAKRLRKRWSEFDLVLVEMSYDDRQAPELVAALLKSGVRIAMTSAETDFRHGIPDFPGIPVLLKPFAETDFVATCEAALAR